MSSLELGFNLNGMIPVSNFSMSSIGKSVESNIAAFAAKMATRADLEIKEQD